MPTSNDAMEAGVLIAKNSLKRMSNAVKYVETIASVRHGDGASGIGLNTQNETVSIINRTDEFLYAGAIVWLRSGEDNKYNAHKLKYPCVSSFGVMQGNARAGGSGTAYVAGTVPVMVTPYHGEGLQFEYDQIPMLSRVDLVENAFYAKWYPLNWGPFQIVGKCARPKWHDFNGSTGSLFYYMCRIDKNYRSIG